MEIDSHYLSFQTPPREIIFIKPNSFIPFTQLRHQINAVLASSKSWPLRKLRVQVPALNITNLARHNLGMSQVLKFDLKVWV
jgi:hypothetical protein